MASDLITIADAAYPFDYTRLPASVRAVLGYVGESGCTPHVWSTQEVQAVRSHGLAWGPIVVPPQRALTTADGTRAADVMAAALPQYGYPQAGPVFLDIERASYDASPGGAADAASAWRNTMIGKGWATAVVYWPKAGPHAWLPDWVGSAPKSLPGECVGQQYAGNVDGGRYDLSVFAPAVFTGLLTGGDGVVANLDKQDQQFIVDQLGKVQQNLADMINALHVGKGGNHEWAANMTAVLHAVTTIPTSGGSSGLTDAQVTALGVSLAAELSKSLPAAVVKALSAALAS